MSDKLKCPYCDSNLILRHGQYGDFWGCSTYPKCHYTRGIGDSVDKNTANEFDWKGVWGDEFMWEDPRDW